MTEIPVAGRLWVSVKLAAVETPATEAVTVYVPGNVLAVAVTLAWPLCRW